MTKDHKRMAEKSYKDFARKEAVGERVSAAFMGVAVWFLLYFLFFS